MSAQQQQQNIFTIHESQLNSSGGGGGARASQSDILIDTSSIPLTQQATMPPMQHHQHSLQPTNVQQQFDMMTGGQSNNGGPSTITSQPMQQHASSSAKVAPEAQNVVYSVHPVFSLLDQQDALLVRQRAEASATCCGFESANTYTVRARDGTPILRAVESESPPARPTIDRALALSRLCVKSVQKSNHFLSIQITLANFSSGLIQWQKQKRTTTTTTTKKAQIAANGVVSRRTASTTCRWFTGRKLWPELGRPIMCHASAATQTRSELSRPRTIPLDTLGSNSPCLATRSTQSLTANCQLTSPALCSSPSRAGCAARPSCVLVCVPTQALEL